jgi:adenylate cyclase
MGKPLMTEDSVKRKLRAILSADVKGYSRLMGEDEVGTYHTLTSNLETIRSIVANHNGRVFSSPGDAVMAQFASVVDAIQCAVKIQKRIEGKNTDVPQDRKMQFRIGVNLGDVIEKEEQIYGDGVNIAARIETLAKPGSVFISRTVYDQVRNKLKFGYEYQGEHAVKNIAQPVSVYRVLTDPEDAGKIIGEEKPKQWRLAVVSVAVVLVLFAGGLSIWNLFLRSFPPPGDAISENMSIAVLPFNNMSNDPEQEYFADGISEDLITDLSKIPDLLVISRLSSFIYKGKSIKVQQIAEELGVLYLLEGSVRKVENRVRINAQLIDAASGHHLWADRYDGDMNDIFALQDKITRKIAESLAVKLTKDDQKRLPQKGTNSMEAYEAYLKGSAIADSLRSDPEKFAESLKWFERAIELDPDYNRAYAALAETYIYGSEFEIQSKLGISSRVAHLRGINYLKRAIKNPTNIAYRIAARVYTYQGQYEKSLDHGARALALGPNEYRSNGFMALNMISAGRPDEGIPFAEKMRRADPACLW